MHFTSTVGASDRPSTTGAIARALLTTWGPAALRATVRALAAIGSDDIRVWSQCHSSGERVWYGYDPRTSDRFCSPSEDELRAWLESRHRYRF